jgi:hypothetical protein
MVLPHRLSVSGIFVLFLTLLIVPVYLAGQAISGDLTGTVLDPAGAGIPNAKVEAVNDATGVTATTNTGQSGEYRFSNLQPGTYTINVNASAFAAGQLRNVRVNLNQIATANVTLAVGQTRTTVEVTEAPAVIDTTTAQVQNTFDSKQAEDLPIAAAGSGIYNLSLLNAGATSSGGVGVGSGPSVGGQRPRNNNFTVDGVDNNNKGVTGPLIQLPNDAVAEFTLLQNQFQPEYGHSSGGQFNTIMKSGTNQIHGRIYEYNQNRNYNAIDQQFARQTPAGEPIFNPRYDNNRLGASIGGPIIKNKWFYFGNFEWNPIGRATSPAGQVFAPTAAGYSMLAADPSVSKTNLGVLQQYAQASSPSGDFAKVGNASIPLGQLSVIAPNFQNNYAAAGTMDYNFSDRDQIRGRFATNRYSYIDVAAQLPAFYTNRNDVVWLGTGAWYHTFGPTLTNEFRLGYNRLTQPIPAGNFQFPGLNMFPQLTFDELGGLQLGPNPNAPQSTVQNLYQGTDNVSFIRGNHSFKFGADVRKSISPQTFTQRVRGDYEYSTLQDYLYDLAPDVTGERSAGNPVYYGDQLSTYFYAQDAWRLRPNFTLNLGIRYEYTQVPYTMRQQTINAVSSVPGVLEFNEPQAQKNNWAPRIGVAYSPGKSGNTSIRAGFGLAYDVLFDNLGLLALPPQLSTTQDVGFPGQPAVGSPSFLKNGGLSGGSAGAAFTADEARAATANYIPSMIKQPYSIQWNFGVQHVFKQNYTFEARYLGTRGVHLYVQSSPNRIARVTPDQSLPTYMSNPGAGALAGLPYTLGQLQALPTIDPRFSAAGFTTPITQYTPQGYSRYNGLALQLNRRFSKGVSIVGSYTWSHLIDNSTAEVFSTVLTPRRPQDMRNLAADQSSSALDRRHRFTAALIYDVPFFKGSNWFMKNIVGNWELAPIYTYESPEYYTVQSGIDSNLNGDAWPDRVIVNPSGAAGTGSAVTAINRQGATVAAGDPSIVAYVASNPNARYIQAGLGAYPNAGRNTEPTRPINNFDVTALKRFNLSDRWRIEFAGQIYNVLNHPQYVPGFTNDIQPTQHSADASVTSFVRLTSANLANGFWNQPGNVFSSSPRNMQLFIKLIW